MKKTHGDAVDVKKWKIYMNQGGDHMIRLDGVTKNYDKFRLDCTLEVKPGNITGLVGVNGAGKSTTFKAMLGLIKTDGGNINLFGKDVREPSQEDKENIGFVMSNTGFCGEFTLKNIIKIIRAMYKNFDEEYFKEMCQRFALPDDQKIKDYSTGMKARLNVIIALSHNAKLLILDEPTAGLDVLARNELLDMLREYVNEERAIIISSHISSDLEGICDDIYVIHDGSIILHQDTDVILDEFGMLKLDRNRYESIDKKYIRYVLEENNGYDCITDNRHFYEDNYPDIVMEKGSIDDFLTIAERGAKL